jgi:hypothetical protein
MLNIYVWENVRFVINVFAALATFGAGWLYFDSWQSQKSVNTLLKFSGFLVLSLSFLAQSAITESPMLVSRLLSNQELLTFIYLCFRYLGYLLLVIGIGLDRTPDKPKTENSLVFSSLVSLPRLSLFLFPLVLAGLYLNRAIRGLEKHLIPVAVSFGLLTLSEMASALSVWRSTDNISIYQLLAPFGPIWICQHLFLLFFSIILLKWVFGYLLKRLFTQIFFILVCITLSVFVITVITFTYLLIGQIKSATLTQTQISAKVLNLTLDSKLQQLQADAQVLAQDKSIVAAAASPAAYSNPNLVNLAKSFLLAKSYRTLTITDAKGSILARGHDTEITPDSISTNPMFTKAASGTAVSALAIDSTSASSTLTLSAAVPVLKENRVVGTILLTTPLDSFFVFNLEKTTGLTASLYTKNQLTASTLPTITLSLNNPVILETVLNKGQLYSGSNTIGSTPYLSTFLPLKSLDNIPLGMLAVGQPEATALSSAGSAVESTFILTALLILASLLPSYFISGYLSRQLK